MNRMKDMIDRVIDTQSNTLEAKLPNSAGCDLMMPLLLFCTRAKGMFCGDHSRVRVSK